MVKVLAASVQSATAVAAAVVCESNTVHEPSVPVLEPSMVNMRGLRIAYNT